MPIAEQTAVAEVPGLEAITNGNYDEGWGELYNHYFPVVTKLVKFSGITKTLETSMEADEIAHDILGNLALRGSSKLKGSSLREKADSGVGGLRDKTDGGIENYLFVAVKHYGTDIIRAKGSRNKNLGHPQPILDEDGSESLTKDDIERLIWPRYLRPDKLWTFWQFEDLAKEVLEDLRPIDRKIVLGLLDELTKTEIAHELGLDPGNMTNRANRAQETARKLLKGKSPEMYREVIRRGGGKKKKTRVNALKGLKVVNSSM